MIPWETLGRAKAPDDDEELVLYRRGEEYAIRIAGNELMNSRVHGSEDALGKLPCKKVSADNPRPRILIGGLGMGFTLASALKHLPLQAEVIVAELVPAVVQWNRDYFGDFNGRPLEDARVQVHEVDVARILKRGKENFDAVLLDVDNGPSGMTQQANNWLYVEAGLNAAQATLRRNGVLAVWSAGPDATFRKRLDQLGFMVDEIKVRAHGKKGPRHVIWMAGKTIY